MFATKPAIAPCLSMSRRLQPLSMFSFMIILSRIGWFENWKSRSRLLKIDLCQFVAERANQTFLGLEQFLLR